jgi:CBS domain-containing protein
MVRSEFADAYDEDERRIRGAILGESIAALNPREPIALPPTASLAEAIAAMNERSTGCVCVVESGALAGILTERDLLRLAQEELRSSEIPIGRVMTADPETLHLEDGIAVALNLMSAKGFRHIPVVDDDARPVGIVAMRDIVRFIVSMFPDTVHNVPPDSRAIQQEHGG